MFCQQLNGPVRQGIALGLPAFLAYISIYIVRTKSGCIQDAQGFFQYYPSNSITRHGNYGPFTHFLGQFGESS
jgi:hypothetical protein